MNQPLIFNPRIAKHKPSNQDRCPFCAIDSLEKIIAQEDDMIWLDNKYPVLENTYQTLIIESSQHLGDIATYSKEHNRKLFAFALQAWQQLEDSQRFKTVALFKNFGPLSGGSLRHPHMQVIGFEEIDAYETIKPDNLDGHLVCQQTDNQARVTISQQPLSSFSEFNVSIDSYRALNQLADTVQQVVQYLMQVYLGGRCESYNLFFYHLEEGLVCKIVPRFVTSPYLIGYHLKQINDPERIAQEVAELQAFIK
ncbi:DUF4931 domain-containing protein [Streptococcus dentasini]